MKTKPKTIDDYLATATAPQRVALEQLRRTILAVAPKAEECISYGLAAFRLNGRALVAFGAWKEHCALYPMSAKTLKKFGKQLKDFSTSKGTVQFTPEKCLPMTVVKKLVQARIAEIAEATHAID